MSDVKQAAVHTEPITVHNVGRTSNQNSPWITPMQRTWLQPLEETISYRPREGEGPPTKYPTLSPCHPQQGAGQGTSYPTPTPSLPHPTLPARTKTGYPPAQPLCPPPPPGRMWCGWCAFCVFTQEDFRVMKIN